MHIRCVGDFTKALGKTLGCNFDKKGKHDKRKARESRVIGVDARTRDDVDPALKRVLPRGILNLISYADRYANSCC